MKLKVMFFLVISFCAILISNTCRADDRSGLPPTTKQEDALNKKHILLFEQGNYTELDKDMNQIQNDYERGKRDEASLTRLFRPFANANPDYEEKFDTWIKDYPQSYAAHETHMRYYKTLSWLARGNNFIKNTSNKQLSGMEDYTKKAMAEGEIAMTLTKKPLLTYCDVIDVAINFGDKATAERMLKKSLDLDPKTYIARLKFMRGLEARWGGSLDKMQEFRKEAQKAGLTREQLSQLDKLIGDEMDWLGNMYLKGDGVKQDYKQALEFYQKGAALGSHWAETAIGLMYAKGQGVDKNDAEAMKWYKKAASEGYWDAYDYIGRLYNAATPANVDEALHSFRVGAEHNDPDAQISLGYMYQQGKGVKKNSFEAIKWYERAASNGNFEAENYIGDIYQFGDDEIPANPAEAVNRYQIGADHGSAYSLFKLGDAYEWGRGVPLDHALAMGWYRKAADQGNTNAEISMGRLISSDAAVHNDLKEEDEAISWYQKAADQGNPDGKKLVELAQQNKRMIQRNAEYYKLKSEGKSSEEIMQILQSQYPTPSPPPLPPAELYPIKSVTVAVRQVSPDSPVQQISCVPGGLKCDLQLVVSSGKPSQPPVTVHAFLNAMGFIDVRFKTTGGMFYSDDTGDKTGFYKATWTRMVRGNNPIIYKATLFGPAVQNMSSRLSVQKEADSKIDHPPIADLEITVTPVR